MSTSGSMVAGEGGIGGMGAGGGGISAASISCLSFTRLASRAGGAGDSSSSRGRLLPVRRPLMGCVAGALARALAAASRAAPVVLGDGFNLRAGKRRREAQAATLTLPVGCLFKLRKAG